MPVNPLVDVKSDLVDVTGSASAGSVTSVTGAPPITSSGGTTPQIGLTTPVALNFGGTFADLSATGGAKQYVKQVGVGAGLTVGTIPAGDVGTGAVLADGTVPLTAAWNAGNFKVSTQNSTGWFNVVAYGADPTGANPATTKAAFQSAITAAQAVNGTVYVPAGTYDCSGNSPTNLTITSQIIIRGDGVLGTTILLPIAADGFVINSIASSQRGVVFMDMQLKANGVSTAGALIHCNGAANFPLIVRNLNFYAHTVALQMESNWASYISENQFLSAVAASTDIWINNLVNQDQGDNQIFENTFWSSGTSNIRQTAGGGTRILGNKFVGPCVQSILLDIPNGKTTSNLLIVGNSLEGNVTGSNIVLGHSGTYNNVAIQDNEFEGTAGQTAIYIGPSATGFCGRGQITGNTFYNCATHVQFNPAQAGGADKWNIANNIFDSPTNAAIWLQAAAANVTNLTIGRNNFIQSGTAPYILGAFSSSSHLDPGIETIFTQTANSTTTANTLTTLFGAGKGSLTIPAGRLMVGTRIRVRAAGFVGVADGGAAAKVYTFTLGGVTVATFTTAALTYTLNAPWWMDATFTVRSTGAGGTVIGNFMGVVLGLVNTFAAATATTAANTPAALAVDFLYNNGNATGSLTTTESSMEILN